MLCTVSTVHVLCTVYCVHVLGTVSMYSTVLCTQTDVFHFQVVMGLGGWGGGGTNDDLSPL